MSKTFEGTIRFPSSFNVESTSPLDDRLVVDIYDDLTNGSISYPYQGMVVNIKGTSELWILKTQGRDASMIPENWELVTGSGSGISEEVEERIQEIRKSLGVLSDLVGEPGDGSEAPTGIFSEIEDLKKKSGSGLSKHSIPVMTPDMVQEAINDPDVEFDESETPHVLIEYDYHETDNANPNIFYEGIIQDMYRSIVTLQAEVTRLRNAFDYGIYSYQDRRTAKSEQIGEPWLADVEAEEPLWAIDPGIGLELVADNSNFNTTLDGNHTL